MLLTAFSKASRKAGRSSSLLSVRPAAMAWPPKRKDGAGQGLRDEVERVAQVYARDRAARTLQRAVVRGREDDRRTVDLFLEAGGDEAHDALVEAAVVERERRKAVDVAARERGLGRLLHLRLELLTGGVEVVEAACIVERDDGIIGKGRHSMPFSIVSRRPAALMRGPSAKPKSRTPAASGFLPATAKSALMPACVRPSLMRLRPWATRMRLFLSSFTTSATVPECDEVDEGVEPGLGLLRVDASLAKQRPEGEEHVVHDAHARKGLRGEGRVREVRIYDADGGRKLGAGQMVVGDDDVDAELRGMAHGFGGGDTVVDGEEHVGARRACGEQVDHGAGEAVAVMDAVRHEVVGLHAHHAESSDRHGAGGGAVAVVVGDDGHAFSALTRERKAFGGLAGALEHGGRQHRLPVLGELGGVPDAACGKRTCDGRQVALFMEASRGLKIEFTVEDAGHCTAPS